MPVNIDGWSVDPFAAEISDGFVWGRGAVDMLNVTAAMAVVFKKYLTGARPPLPGDLIFAAVADEEAAGGLGARYLVDERYDLVQTEYVLTEVAYPAIPTPSGPIHPVVAGEKGPFWSKLRSTGTPGPWLRALPGRQCPRTDGRRPRRAVRHPYSGGDHRPVASLRRRSGAIRRPR